MVTGRGPQVLGDRDEFAARLDQVRIAALRDQRAANIPQIEAERQAALFRLATLTGRTPQDLPATAGARPATPAAQPTAARHPCPKHVSAALTAAARLSFTSAAAVIAAVAAAVRGVQR